MVLASRPVVSASRLAARPVGAHSASRTPRTRRTPRIAFISVVLPTPGPPVITRNLDRTASFSASACRAASFMPSRSSIHGMARSASIARHGGCPAQRLRMRAPITRSAACRPARKTHGVPSTLSPTIVPSATSSSSAPAMSDSGTSSSLAAVACSSWSGRPQWPSSIASLSAYPTPARARIMAVFSMPSVPAIRSAVRKPMPRMSAASR